jgi:hypothetical protein
MKTAVVFDRIASFAAHEWRALTQSVPAFFHAVADFARTAPTNVWAMCAFVAAGSILVTVVTMYLWPTVAPETAPVRETMDASGVRRLARGGLGVPDIARRTGLSHDAVATILRASTLPRGEHTAATRKTRPTAA